MGACGITYIIGGGLAITHSPGAILPMSQAYARRSHFVLAEIQSDRIEVTGLSAEGETLDQATFLLPPSVPYAH